MSSFDNGPSATSSFDDAPSRRFESAAPEFRSTVFNQSNPYDLSTYMGQHLMSHPIGSGLPLPWLSCPLYGLARPSRMRTGSLKSTVIPGLRSFMNSM